MELIPHHITHIVLASAAALLLTAAAAFSYLRLRQTEKCLVPGAKPTPATLFEVAVEAILGLMEGVMGPHAEKHLPLIGTLFIYIFVCNIVGLIPGLGGAPTANTSTNGAMALVVLVYCFYLGVEKHGFLKFLKHFLGPFGLKWKFLLITIIFLAIEIFTFFAIRPFTLTLRLWGNMTGDHKVLEIFSELIPFGIPILFLGLGLFISFIQAFVFSLLSIVYITLTIGTEH